MTPTKPCVETVSVEKKEHKFLHISIDPGSTSMGVACFTTEGKYVDSFEVKVGDGVISSKRLYFMRLAFEKKWEDLFGKTKKESLRNLVASVLEFERELDNEMKKPSSPERGATIARLSNKLTMANQSAMRALGFSWEKINKLYNITNK